MEHHKHLYTYLCELLDCSFLGQMGCLHRYTIFLARWLPHYSYLSPNQKVHSGFHLVEG